MKWILVGMSYVAIAAAAFSQESWVYADLLWAAAFVAICYALLLAAVSKGRARAMAGGFALFAVGFALCASFARDATPTARILEAAGVNEYGTPLPHPLAPVPIYPSTRPSAPPPKYQGYSPPPSGVVNVFQSPNPPSTTNITVFPTPVIMGPSLFPQKLRAANAMAAMACGLLGCALAAGAYRRYQRESAGV